MAYYLMLESKKGEYIPMNISSSLYFTRNPHYKKEGACTLNEIDLFTACFENEEEMRMHLLENGIMPINKMDKRLSIRISNRGHYNKVLHGFLFRKDLEYINNPYKLIDMIMKRYYGNNLMLIQKISNYFLEFYECRNTANEVNHLINISIRTGVKHYRLEEYDENGDNLVHRLLKLIVFEYYQDPMTGRVEYYNKVNYKNLHSLIAFVNNYDEKIRELYASDEKSSVKVRKKTLNNNGQITFDDINKNTSN